MIWRIKKGKGVSLHKMINTRHKDRLFQKLFGEESNKENLLSLFNALNGTNYTNLDDFEINTLEDVIYMGMKNDVSCILDDYMSLYEHQSTYNPNMPIRGFMYFGRLYDKHIKKNKFNMYSDKLLMLPTPRYFVLYNGSKDEPDILELKLSDSFIHNDVCGKFEWTATMVNINYGHNTALMDVCHTLKEYSIFVDKIKKYREKGLSVEESVKLVVDECIEENVLRDYLITHKSEVIGMCLTEYDEEATMEAFKRESYMDGVEEGKKEGLKEGVKEVAKNMLKRGVEVAEIILCTGLSESEINRLR